MQEGVACTAREERETHWRSGPLQRQMTAARPSCFKLSLGLSGPIVADTVHTVHTLHLSVRYQDESWPVLRNPPDGASVGSLPVRGGPGIPLWTKPHLLETALAPRDQSHFGFGVTPSLSLLLLRYGIVNVPAYLSCWSSTCIKLSVCRSHSFP